MEKKRVGIVLFEDIEVLDFCGPFEVFCAARLNEEKRRDEPSPFEVWLVAEHPEAITNDVGHPKSFFVDRAQEERFVLETCMYFPFVTAKNLKS